MQTLPLSDHGRDSAQPLRTTGHTQGNARFGPSSSQHLPKWYTRQRSCEYAVPGYCRASALRHRSMPAQTSCHCSVQDTCTPSRHSPDVFDGSLRTDAEQCLSTAICHEDNAGPLRSKRRGQCTIRMIHTLLRRKRRVSCGGRDRGTKRVP